MAKPKRSKQRFTVKDLRKFNKAARAVEARMNRIIEDNPEWKEKLRKAGIWKSGSVDE